MTAAEPATVAAGSTPQNAPDARLAAVRRDIAAACARAGRPLGSVTLIAVSKTVPADGVRPAVQAGHRAFGENRVQEAGAKWPPLRAVHDGLELHLIGPLQTNKARDAVAIFDVIHTVDRAALCAALARQCAEQGRTPALLVQVNTGAEPQKSGIAPAAADRFLAACRDDHGLRIAGLMCIPPVGEAAARHFDLLAQIAGRNGLGWLSMGMSGDYREAISCGATHVRVGTAIFGARPRNGAQTGG